MTMSQRSCNGCFTGPTRGNPSWNARLSKRKRTATGPCDCVSQWRIFQQVYVPLGRAPVATVLILGAVSVGNDVIHPSVDMQSDENYTLPMGVLQSVGRTVDEIATQTGVLAIATALPLILYLV